MLDEAGFKPGADGTRFTIRLVFRAQRAEEAQMAQIVQRNWQAVGVKVSWSRPRAPSSTRRSSRSTTTTSPCSTTRPAAIRRSASRASTRRESINPAAIYNNVSQYSNPEVDALWAKGRDAANQAGRAEAYFKVQELIARDLPTLTIHEQAQINAARVEVKDLFLAAHYPWWGAIWMTK